MGPGFGASTRWITRSEYRQLDLARRIDAHRHTRHAPVRPWPAVAAAGRIPSPAMPRAGQLAAIQNAFAERTAVVRAVIVQCVQHAVDVGQRIPALAGLYRK